MNILIISIVTVVILFIVWLMIKIHTSTHTEIKEYDIVVLKNDKINLIENTSLNNYDVVKIILNKTFIFGKEQSHLSEYKFIKYDLDDGTDWDGGW